MILGIDASRYHHPEPTGVEVYSDKIIDALLRIARKQKKHRLRLYTPRPLNGIAAEWQQVVPGRRLWTQRHLARALREDPPDVLFVPSHVPPLRTLISPKSDVRTVVTIHDVCFRAFPQAYSLRQFAYLELTTRLSTHWARRIIVPSEATAHDLQRLYDCPATTLSVIPHGFEPSTSTVSSKEESSILSSFGFTPDTPYFFFVGRLETKKNIARLVEAFAQFRVTHPDWWLVLGGSRGVGFPKILRELTRKKLLHQVLMPGYVHPEEKIALYRHAKGFVFPSLAEGFGFPILEAAAHRLPILASDLPVFEGFKGLIRVSVDPLDTPSIGQGLEALSTAKPLPTSSAQQLADFSWKKAGRAVWDLLTEPTE